MRDFDIRISLMKYLKRIHEREDVLIIEELGLCTGNARVDVSVINGHIAGYEIKSDRDTLTRLPSQVEIYSRTLDRVTVVACAPHIEKITGCVPEWFGITEAFNDSGTVELRIIRPGRPNQSVDPYSLVQLLWRDEALSLLTEFGLERGLKSKPRAAIWKKLAESKSIEELGRIVRHQLRIRENWRGASK